MTDIILDEVSADLKRQMNLPKKVWFDFNKLFKTTKINIDA